jgi:hypothetical protein
VEELRAQLGEARRACADAEARSAAAEASATKAHADAELTMGSASHQAKEGVSLRARVAQLEGELEGLRASRRAALEQRDATVAELRRSLEQTQLEAERLQQQAEAEHQSQMDAMQTREQGLLRENAACQAETHTAQAAAAAAAAGQAAMVAELEQLRDRQREHEEVCRRLNDKVQELKGSVRVCCRVRPLLSGEQEGVAQADGAVVPVLGFPTGAAAPAEFTMLGRAVLKVHGVGPKGDGSNLFGFDQVGVPAGCRIRRAGCLPTVSRIRWRLQCRFSSGWRRIRALPVPFKPCAQRRCQQLGE